MIDVPPTWYTKVKEKCETESDKIHVIFFDELANALPSIQGMAFNIVLDGEVNNLSDIDNLKFYGGGGTNFGVAVRAFTKRVENKIIFTDGEANMPGEAIDAIWIVFGGTKINPKGGKVINISEEHLDKLLTNYYQDSEYSEKIR